MCDLNTMDSLATQKERLVSQSMTISPTIPAMESMQVAEPTRDPVFVSLLYMCEYPPSTTMGAPIIAKQLLRNYDSSKLHILCCKRVYRNVSTLTRASYLDCDYTLVPSATRHWMRPRRVFGPLMETVNCGRIPLILARARKIIEEKKVSALFTIPWRCDFALAAYLLHRETGLPLYVFETDDWEAMNTLLLHGFLTRKYHAPLLQAAKQVWMISPQMCRMYRDRFSINGRFLFHFVDLERYQQASAHAERDNNGPITMVYTGSINDMFYDTMKFVCDMLNGGLVVNGRPVEMHIYGGRCPEDFLGPRVFYEGFVDSDEIPRILANADLTFIGVSFSQEERILDLVKTSLYTKTIDYLASGRPVLVVSPAYSGEVDYFKDVTHVVTSLGSRAIADALHHIIVGKAVPDRCARGIELVRKRHSLDAIRPLFLNHFLEDGSSDAAR